VDRDATFIVLKKRGRKGGPGKLSIRLLLGAHLLAPVRRNRAPAPERDHCYS
jgi:hypothetical protein